MKPVVFHEDAEARAAIEYYEKQRAGLGAEFQELLEHSEPVSCHELSAPSPHSHLQSLLYRQCYGLILVYERIIKPDFLQLPLVALFDEEASATQHVRPVLGTVMDGGPEIHRRCPVGQLFHVEA